MSNSEDEDLRPEYDLKKLGPGVRGKYYRRYQESTNVVVIDSGLHGAFPIKAERVGYIVFEDDVHVIAEPFADTETDVSRFVWP